MSPVDQDARQGGYVAAACAIVGLQPVPGEQLGRPYESGDRVSMWIVRAEAAIDDSPQWVVGDIAGYRAVIVVLSDDDVGALFPAELADLVHDPA